MSDAAVSAHRKVAAETDRIRAIKPTVDSYYKKVKGTRLPIKMYIPSEGENKKIAVLTIHGGGWYAITKDADKWDGSWLNYQAQYYYDKHGYTTAAISYRSIRIAEDTNVFDLIEDCRDAVNYMREKAEFDKLILLGDSAGGHMAVVLGMDDTVGVDLVIAANPVLDLTEESWDYTAKTEEDRKKASPLFHIKKCKTKFFVLHGNADTMVNHRISKKFCEKMKKAGTQCDFAELAGREHAFLLSRYHSTDEEINEYMNTIDQYIANHLDG